MIFKKKHKCWMEVTQVTHEKIQNRGYTHILKTCTTCGDWDVETLPGLWEVEDFKLKQE